MAPFKLCVTSCDSSLVRDILQMSSRPLLHDNEMRIMRIFTLCNGCVCSFRTILFSKNVAELCERFCDIFRWNTLQQRCILSIMGGGTLSVDNEVGGAPIVCKQWRALPTLLSVSSFRRPCLVYDRSWQCVVNTMSIKRNLSLLQSDIH